MKDPIPQFTYLIKELSALKLSYVHVVNSGIAGNADVVGTDSLDFAIEAWGPERPIIIAGGYTTPEAAKLEAEKGDNVIIAFGRYFISNPDLPYKIKKGIPWTKYDRDTFYLPKSPVGYIDYPFSQEFLEESKSNL